MVHWFERPSSRSTHEPLIEVLFLNISQQKVGWLRVSWSRGGISRTSLNTSTGGLSLALLNRSEAMFECYTLAFRTIFSLSVRFCRSRLADTMIRLTVLN